jgi:hypothetical protein
MSEETYTVLVDPVMIDASEMQELLEEAIFDYAVQVANSNGVDLGSTRFDDYYKDVRETAEEVFKYTHYFQYVAMVTVKSMLETGMASLTISSTTVDTVERDLTKAVQILSTILAGALVHITVAKNDTWAANEVIEEAPKETRSVPFDFQAQLLEKENNDS